MRRHDLCDNQATGMCPVGHRRRLFGVARLALAASLILLAGCAAAATSTAHAPDAKQPASTSESLSTRTPSIDPSQAGPALPAFSDWRVAYIGQDADLHIISLDGRTDLTGAQLPIYGPAGTGVFTAGASPDGAHLAYGDSGGVTYLDLHADTATVLHAANTGYAFEGSAMLWSPDGRALVIERRLQDNAIVQFPSGAVTQAPGDNLSGNGMALSVTPSVYGWLDTTHLAVDDLAIENPTPPTPSRVITPQTTASLGSLNITTGQVRPIVTLRSPTMVLGFFSLASDPSEALFYNADEQDLPFTLDVQRIDLATGHATPLPAIARITPFSQLLWQPHAHKALAVTGGIYQPIHFYMIDIDQDRVTPLTLAGFPLAWSPDGATLILERGKQLPPPAGEGSNTNGDGEEGPIPGFNDVGSVGSGPYTLTADTFDANWNVTTSVTLTTRAMQIPVLGFVRNP